MLEYLRKLRMSVRRQLFLTAFQFAFGVALCGSGILISCGGGTNPPAPPAPPTLQSVDVSPQNGNVAAGLTQQCSASGNYSDGTSKPISNITWATSDATIATVNSTGMVTTLKQGSVNVSATSGTLTGSTALTVGPPNLISIAVSPQSPTIPTGQIQQFTATGSYSDGSTQNLVSVTWSSGMPNVATISNIGLATGVTAGSSSIEATSAGVNGSTTLTVTTTAKPEMLYVASGSNGQGEILAYTIDPSSGQLSTPVPINAPTYLFEMHVDPTGKFLYASDFDMGAVRVYSINSSTGILTEVTGSPFTSTQVTGNGGPLAASPDGNFLFYSNASGDIATFTVSSGVLTATGGVAHDPGQPSQMVVDPTAKFLYVANHADYVVGGQFSVFAIDSNTGALTEISGSPFNYQSNAEPSGIGMHPSGKFLYTALSNSSGVDGVSVNTGTGALTLITGAPWSTGSFLPDYVAMAPSGSFLYVSQKGVGAVNSFSIDQTTGVLKLLQTLDGGDPSQMVVDSTGKRLYASDTAFKGVSVYAIDQISGSLGPPVDVPAGDVPGAIAIVQLH